MMCVSNKLNSIIEELKNAFINVDEDKANKIVNYIISADRIFITWSGQEGFSKPFGCWQNTVSER